MPNKKRTEASIQARKYCEQFPDAGSRTIARKLLADFPGLYADLESARHYVRYHRGALGEALRERVAGGVVPRVPAGLQEPAKEPDYEFPIGKKPLWGVILSDLQIPWHDEVALQAALEYAKEQRHTDFCILNGDIADCHTLSAYERDPRTRNYVEELELVNRVLDVICDVFGFVVFKQGNHEKRLIRYMYTNAPQFVGLKELTWRYLLRAEERKMPVVDEGSLIRLPNLTILHGHEFGGFMSNPVNPARGLFTRAKANAIQGHCHQTSHHSEGTVGGERISCWSTGCLSDLRPRYRPLAYTKWNHGFARLAIEGEKFWVRNHEIADGRVF